MATIVASLERQEKQFAFTDNPPQTFLRKVALNAVGPIVSNSPICDLKVTSTFKNKDGVTCIGGIKCRTSGMCKSELCGFKG